MSISRGAVTYLTRTMSAADLALLRRLDELHLEHLFMGARMLRNQLQRQDISVGRRHLGTLPRCMRIAAPAPHSGTSTSTLGHRIYPYLLRDLEIVRANQVWALDTTRIAMTRGFMYLTAVVDVVSRKVFAHRVAITLEAVRAVEVMTPVFARFGVPEIVNMLQGRQFTAEDFTAAVRDQSCELSMDGRGAWPDDVFVQRLWLSEKYERVSLKAYGNASGARTDIADYASWNSSHRSHSRLERLTPNDEYLATTPPLQQAA